MYPIAGLFLMRLTSGATGIPTPEHWVVFTFVLPLLITGVVLWAKLAGTKFNWTGVTLFAIWMTAVAWFHHWLIAAIWAVI